MIKICGDPCCEAIFHNVEKKNKKCNDCGGRIILINDDTYKKKYASNFFQYDYKSMDYYRPEQKVINHQLKLF